MAAGGSAQLRQQLERVLGWPTRRILDRRVEWTIAALDERLSQLATLLTGRMATHSRELQERLNELRESQHELFERLAPLRGGELVANEGRLELLGQDTAGFLNWADGHEGYAAQAGLWFNPPVAVQYSAGRVETRMVNERIVEQPFVYRALSGVTPPARVLDVGGSESTVALSLATLGYEVTVVDPRGYPLAHPRLHAVTARTDQLGADEVGFDVILALSAVEHFGLGHYGLPATDERLDLRAMADLRGRLAHDGLLVLTVPFGEAQVSHFERVYDADGLGELLTGWEPVSTAAAWHTDRSTWLWGELDHPEAARGVALVVARAGAAPEATQPTDTND